MTEAEREDFLADPLRLEPFDLEAILAAPPPGPPDVPLKQSNVVRRYLNGERMTKGGKDGE